MKKLKTKKQSQDAQKKWCSHKVSGGSPEAGRKKVCVGKDLWKR